jgi:hypothetical protein
VVDFARLVLGPNLAVYAWPVIFSPLKSQPGEAPFTGRGIFSSQHTEVMMADGSTLSDQNTTLAIRLSEFVVMPEVGDTAQVLNPYTGKVVGDYWVADHHEDGQGGATLQLRFIEPQPSS